MGKKERGKEFKGRERKEKRPPERTLDRDTCRRERWTQKCAKSLACTLSIPTLTKHSIS